MYYALMILLMATPHGGFARTDLKTEMTFATAAQCAVSQKDIAGTLQDKGYRGEVRCVPLRDIARAGNMPALKPIAFGPVQVANKGD